MKESVIIKYLSKTIVYTIFASQLILFSGCTPKTSSEHSEIQIHLSESAQSFVPEQIDVTDTAKVITHANYNNNSIFYCGYDPQKIVPDLQSDIINLKEKTSVTIEFNSDLVGLSDHQLISSDAVYVEYQTFCESVSAIEKYDRFSGELLNSKETDYFDSADDMFSDSDGNICLFTRRNANGNLIAELQRYTPELEYIETINLNSIVNEDYCAPVKYLPADNCVYLFWKDSKGIIKYAKTDDHYNTLFVSTLPDGSENVQDCFIDSERNIVIITFDDDKNEVMIDKINPQNGQLIDMISVPDIPSYNICGAYEDYDLLYMKDNSIFGYNTENDRHEIIFEYQNDVSKNLIGYSVFDNELLVYYTLPLDPFRKIYCSDDHGTLLDIYSHNSSTEENILDFCGTEIGVFTVAKDSKDNIVLYFTDKSGTTCSANYTFSESSPCISSINSENILICCKEDNKYRISEIAPSLDILSDIYIDVSEVNDICTGNNNEVFILDSDSNQIIKISSSTGDISDRIELNGLFESDDIFLSNGTGEYAFYLTYASSIYGYSESDHNFILTADLIDSNFQITGNIYSIDEYNFICTGINGSSEFPSERPESSIGLYKLSRSDKNVSKKELSVVSFGKTNSDFISSLKSYNSASAEYIFKVKEYTTDELNKLYTDIESGLTPDILLTDSYYVMQHFSKNNMNSDLTSFFDTDTSTSKDNICDNVLRSVSSENKIKFIYPSYTVSGILVQQTTTDENTKWELNDLTASISREYENKQISVDYKTLIQSTILDSLYGYIDFTDRKCNFINSEFYDYLNILEKIKNQNSDEYASQSHSSFDLVSIKCFTDYNTAAENSNEQKILQPIPGPIGSSYITDPDFMISIFEISENKSEAWNLIKQFLNEDYQLHIAEKADGFPVTKSALNKMQEIEMSKETITYSDNDSKTIRIESLSSERAEGLRNILSDSWRIKTDIPKINNIIISETDNSGSKPADEISEIIQKKVSVYLKESE